MPKGQKAIDWTEANDIKLFLTIMAVENIHPNPKKIAEAFGMGLNAMAISNRLSKLRMKAKELGVEPSASTESSKTVTKRAPAARKGNGKGHKPVGGMLGEDAQSDDDPVHVKDDANVEQALTPPETDSNDNHSSNLTHTSRPEKRQKTISGRVTKSRASPRKASKKDYKALGDPFVAMNGTIDGEKVFTTDRSESEDSYPSDPEFVKDAQAATIKMEEAI